MKKSFKAITGTTLLLILLALTGCQDNTNNDVPPDSNTNQESETEKVSKILNYDYNVKETIYQHDDGRKIYGQFYLPDNKADNYPTMIMSHGLGGSYKDAIIYAEYLASKGYACYIFDFCGGSTKSMSDGNLSEMSVITEVDDLNVVLDSVKNESFVDTDRIVLMGGSQGGLVSALVASDRKDEIAGLVLMFPAFVIPDYVDQLYSNLENTNVDPSTLDLPVGKKYIEDVKDMDVYEEIKGYDKKVLIIHGTDDKVVPIDYSRKAVETYSNAQLEVIEGAGHGFYDQKSILITEKVTLDYLKEILK